MSTRRRQGQAYNGRNMEEEYQSETLFCSSPSVNKCYAVLQYIQEIAKPFLTGSYFSSRKQFLSFVKENVFAIIVC